MGKDSTRAARKNWSRTGIVDAGSIAPQTGRRTARAFPRPPYGLFPADLLLGWRMLTRDEVHPAQRPGCPSCWPACCSPCWPGARAPPGPLPRRARPPRQHTTGVPRRALRGGPCRPVPVMRGPGTGPDDPAPAGRAAVRRGAGRQRAGFRHGERDPGVPLRLGQFHRHGHRRRRACAVSRAVQALSSPQVTAGSVLRAANQEGVRSRRCRARVRHHAERRRAGRLTPVQLQRLARLGSGTPGRGVNLNFAPVMDVVRLRTPPGTRPSGS